MHWIDALGDKGKQAIFFGLVFMVFYLFIIRPKQKEENQKTQFVDSLSKGTSVVTIGGIHGKVVDVGEETVVLEIDKKGSQITIAKQAISPKPKAKA